MATERVKIVPVDMERDDRSVEFGVIDRSTAPVYLGKTVMRDIKTDAASQQPIYFLNGLACYTEPVARTIDGITSTSYWIRGGSDLIQHASCGNIGMIELDFSPAGAVTIVPLSRCTVSNNLILTPVSMKNKIPMMSIAGHMYFSDEVVRRDDYHLQFTMDQLEMAKVFLLRNKQLFGEKFPLTTTVLQEVDNLIVRLWAVTYPINFILLLEADALEVDHLQQLYALGLHQVKFNGRVGGLLRSIALKEVIGHVRAEYNPVQTTIPEIGTMHTALSVTPTNRFQIAHHGNFITDIGFQTTNRTLRYHSRNYTDNQYELLNFYYYKET